MRPTALACLALALAAPLRAQEADSLSVLLGGGLSAQARAEIERHLARRPLIFEGDVHVPRDSLVPRDVLVVDGTLTFQGRTLGTLMVVGGDIFLRPGAEVAGDVVVIGGGFYGTGMANVQGERRVIRGEKVTVLRRAGGMEVSAEREPRRFPVALEGLYGFLPEMYNRVDGLAVSWGLRYVPQHRRREAPRLSAHAILRTSRENVGWEATAEKEWLSLLLVLRGTFYSLTDTNERWHRGDVETSLATLFLGEDNRFYFDRRGVELWATRDIRGPLSLELGFRNDTYRTVVTQDPFTIASDDFLPNPPVPRGTMRSFLARAAWDSRDDPEDTTLGWWAVIEAEAAGGFLEGDYDLTAGRLDVRRYQPVGGHRLDARLVLGGRIGGTLPEQKRYHLGGAATLPGYEGLSVGGDRAALVNLRYRIPISALRRFSLFREGAWVALLADGGDAWDSEAGEDLAWLSSAGLGLAGRGPLSDVGVYVVVPSEQITSDQSDVSVFLYFGRFF